MHRRTNLVARATRRPRFAYLGIKQKTKDYMSINRPLQVH